VAIFLKTSYRTTTKMLKLRTFALLSSARRIIRPHVACIVPANRSATEQHRVSFANTFTSSATLEGEKKKLLYRAKQTGDCFIFEFQIISLNNDDVITGMLEVDLVLGNWAEKNLASLNGASLEEVSCCFSSFSHIYPFSLRKFWLVRQRICRIGS
jgi:hypothetical protein